MAKERTMFVLIAVEPPSKSNSNYVASCETICSSSDANARDLAVAAVQLSHIARGELVALPQSTGEDKNAALAKAFEVLKRHFGLEMEDNEPGEQIWLPGGSNYTTEKSSRLSIVKSPAYACFSRMDEAVKEARPDQYIVMAESIATGNDSYFVIDSLDQMAGRKLVIMQSPKVVTQ